MEQDCEEIYRDKDMQDGVDVPALRRCIPDRDTERDLVLSSACVLPLWHRWAQAGTLNTKKKLYTFKKLRERKRQRVWLFPEISLWTQRNTKLGKQSDAFRESPVHGIQWYVCKENACVGTVPFSCVEYTRRCVCPKFWWTCREESKKLFHHGADVRRCYQTQRKL